MEVVAGASLLIKNTVGIAGVLTVGVVCLYPVLKMVAIVALQLVASFVEPLGDAAAADCLGDFADSLSPGLLQQPRVSCSSYPSP